MAPSHFRVRRSPIVAAGCEWRDESQPVGGRQPQAPASRSHDFTKLFSCLDTTSGPRVMAGSGGSVHLISDTAWDETMLTWANHPAVDGPAVATLGPITTSGAVVEVNLDGAISGDGVYNLAIDGTSPDGAGYNSGAATSWQKPTLVLTVASAPSPMAHIVQPPTGATFFDGDPITLQATAVDVDGSDLGAGVTWTSSVQGLLGTGATLTTLLSVGSHTVTASVTGTAGTQAMDRVTVTVRPPPAADTEPLVAITA